MLVLSRHKDQRVIIGDDIVVTVVDLRKDAVRLGFEAPIAVSVHRSEVYEHIHSKETKTNGSAVLRIPGHSLPLSSRLRDVLDDPNILMTDRQRQAIMDAMATITRSENHKKERRLP